jgi:hypothetical protein
MVTSTRTPEGTPNHCPVCQNSIRVEPSILFGDAPCPVCGCLLWFVVLGGNVRYFRATGEFACREKVIEFMARQLGVDEAVVRADSSKFIEDLSPDSLDLVELVMELEEEVD